MASDGATRCHAVVLPPRYKRATRTLMPHIRGTVPAIVGLHALHDTLNGACAEVVAAGRCQAARTHDRFFLPSWTRQRTIYTFCLIRLNSFVSFNSNMAHWPVLIRPQSQSSSSAAFRPWSTSLSSRSLSASTQTKSDAIENEVMNELTGDSSCDVSRLAR